MITILANLEEGYESTYEHLAFRQLKGAYQCKLVSVRHEYATFDEALQNTRGTIVFMVPPGRVSWSTEFSKWTPPPGDITFCLGSPQENMVRKIAQNSVALHITTPDPAVDMMAVCVAGIILYVHG